MPSNLARRVVDDLMRYGDVRRGSIGYLQVENLTTQLAAEFGAKTTTGALVSRMTRNSEAYDVGLRPGDVITAFNGKPIEDASQFSRIVADAKIGTTATLTVLRAGRTLEVKIPIRQNPQSLR